MAKRTLVENIRNCGIVSFCFGMLYLLSDKASMLMAAGEKGSALATSEMVIFGSIILFLIYESFAELGKKKVVYIGVGLMWLMVPQYRNSFFYYGKKFYDVAHHAFEIAQGETILFLVLLMFLVAIVNASGIIERICILLVKKSGGDIRKILSWLAYLTCFMAGVLDGATVGLLFGNIVYTICALAGIQFVRPLLMVAFVSGSCGIFTKIGEVTNIIGGNNLGYSINFFLKNLTIPAIVFAFVAERYFLRGITGKVSLEEVKSKIGGFPEKISKIEKTSIAGILVLMVLLVLHMHFGMEEYVCVFIASTIAMLGVDKDSFVKIISKWKEEVGEIFFLPGIFLGVHVLEHLQLFEEGSKMIAKAANQFLVASVLMPAVSLLSAVTDNIVVADVVTKTIAKIPGGSQCLAEVTFMAVALGGTLTFIGSLQSISIYIIMKSKGKNIGFLEWTSYIVVPFSICAVFGVLYSFRHLI